MSLDSWILTLTNQISTDDSEILRDEFKRALTEYDNRFGIHELESSIHHRIWMTHDAFNIYSDILFNAAYNS